MFFRVFRPGLENHVIELQGRGVFQDVVWTLGVKNTDLDHPYIAETSSENIDYVRDRLSVLGMDGFISGMPDPIRTSSFTIL